MTVLPAGIVPRLLTKQQAAAYCALTPSRFYQLVKAGTFPAAIPGTTRYDRKAIDVALDKLGGLTPISELPAYDQWLAEDGAREPLSSLQKWLADQPDN